LGASGFLNNEKVNATPRESSPNCFVTVARRDFPGFPLTRATHAAKRCLSPFQGATVDIGWEAAVTPPSLDLKDHGGFGVCRGPLVGPEGNHAVRNG